MLNQEQLDAIENAQSEGLTLAGIAREIGISDSVLSRLRSGKYKGDVESNVERVARWVEAQKGRQSLTVEEGPGWVQTPTATKVLNVCKYAQALNCLGVVYGAPGLGKSSALAHYRETTPNVWLVSANPTIRSTAAVLEMVADGLGMTALPQAASRIHRRCVERMVRTRGLLIVDEAQHLDVVGLEALRALHDEAQVGLVLAGNEHVYAGITGGQRSVTYSQLFSRVGKKVQLKKATGEDADAILDAWGIDDERARDLLRKAAPLPGGLRVVTYTLKLAAMLAKAENTAPTHAHIRAAYRELGMDKH